MGQVPANTEGEIAASNGVLKVRKPKSANKYQMSGACFLNCLKALRYGYVLFSMADPEGAQWFALSAVSGYIDIFDLLVLRGREP